uniref:Uncharacterized protein n=1 Tax=Lepeophtheirus salmonis TaxID=72036 RepID=A0A0K2VC37_LEPSM
MSWKSHNKSLLRYRLYKPNIWFFLILL